MKSLIPLICLTSLVVAASAAQAEIALFPAEVRLDPATPSQSLLVQRQDGETIGGQVHDGVTFTVGDGEIVEIRDGVVHALGNGTTTITASVDGHEATTQVTVEGLEESYTWDFRKDVLPILARQDCNSGGCHGTLAGKGGFRLSLLGYDAEADHFNIVNQDRGRRVELSSPGHSLVLAKPTGAVPHKGGTRFDVDSREYQVLSSWIAQGARPPSQEDPELESLEIYPQQSLQEVGSTQRFLVQARFADGTMRDVTPWVKWSSSDETVSQVDHDGQAEVIGPGEGAIVAWYSSKLVLGRLTVPFPDSELAADEITDRRDPRNFIDTQIDRQLSQLNLPPSPECDDGEFIRRVMVDTVGRIPTADEVRAFLTDTSEDKRDQLIDRLLESPEFVDYWTYKWSDVLMLNGNLLRPEALKTYYEWIHNHVEQNSPWDEMVREILTSTGESTKNGATNFYALYQSPEEMTENASQAFLGLSIGCAKCHNHPLEKWTNDQYYAMSNMFARVRAKGWGGEGRNGDGLRTLYVAASGDLVQPRIGKPQPPAPLDGEPVAMDDPTDRRIHLADWLVSPENPYFAKAITNRVWHNYFGVGLVESVDDLRLSNPASNEPLMAEATQLVIDSGFDLKPLMRAILQSNAYQRSSRPVGQNAQDKRFYSRYFPRRMMAEVLHDAVVEVTEVPSKFEWIGFPGNDRQQTSFYPEGTKAIQLYDSAVENYFLQAFGRNPRQIVCECERSSEATMTQVLHISNGDAINAKLQEPGKRIDRLLTLRRQGMSDDAVLDEVYLTCLARYPQPHEREQLREIFPPSGSEEERVVLEDLFWGIMSSREFLFNH